MKPKVAPKRKPFAVAVDMKRLRSIAEKVSAAIGQKSMVVVPEAEDMAQMDFVSTGYQEIDDVISAEMDPKDGSLWVPGTGKGFPRGRIVEIYGPEAAAKTTLALLLVASVQQRGGTAAFLDVEHALANENAQRLGVKTDQWIYSEPESAEQALLAMRELVKAGVDIVVLDSVAALLPENEAEAKAGKMLPGLQARLMSQACRKLVGEASKHNTLVVFINQLRMKIGVMFGNPEVTTGGNALKFYASIRVDVRKIEALKKDGRHRGVRVRARVVKNKIAPPFREVVFDVLFGQGLRIPKFREMQKRNKPGQAEVEAEDGE